jgi:hypothetical protein
MYAVPLKFSAFSVSKALDIIKCEIKRDTGISFKENIYEVKPQSK